MIKYALTIIAIIAAAYSGLSQVKFAFSPEDQKSVEHMIEEERLAVELYQMLAKVWDQPIFKEILAEEKVHLVRVQRLGKKYHVEESQREYGEYLDQNLQNLFNGFRIRANASEKEALLVAAEFEERDIVDLQKYFNTTDNADLIITYEFLLEEAKDHLRIIYKVLSEKGINYTPVYMHEDYFNEIVRRIPISLK